MTEGAFEAKKHAYRQTADGVVISFLVHPNDINAALAIAPLGTIYAIGFREMPDGDQSAGERSDAGPARADELESRPRGGSTTGGGHDVQNRGIAPLSSASPGVMTGDAQDKPRRPFHELPPTTQAVLACQDERFIRWVTGTTYDKGACADWVRVECGVESRAELNSNATAANKWHTMYARYRRETGLEAEPR